MSVVRVSLYTALVLIATIVLQVYTPATRGYFNLGEVAIYTVAALSSPLTAGIAGGVGSALADLLTGYGIFAPGTLVIKFTEGFVASLLISSFRKKLGAFFKLRIASVVIGVFLGILIAALGVALFTGEIELYSVPPRATSTPNSKISVTCMSGYINLEKSDSPSSDLLPSIVRALLTLAKLADLATLSKVAQYPESLTKSSA